MHGSTGVHSQDELSLALACLTSERERLEFALTCVRETNEVMHESIASFQGTPSEVWSMKLLFLLNRLKIRRLEQTISQLEH